jgi:uncharacterized protein with HEPN domain
MKDDLVYVGHILDLAAKAMARLRGRSREQFDADEDFRIVIAHLIQNIGEAARRVSDGFQQRHPHVPWKEMIGMRHKIVHDYMDVDYDIVWDVAITELAPIVAVLKPLLPPEDAPS